MVNINVNEKFFEDRKCERKDKHYYEKDSNDNQFVDQLFIWKSIMQEIGEKKVINKRWVVK